MDGPAGGGGSDGALGDNTTSGATGSDDSPQFEDWVTDFNGRVISVIRKWVVGAFFGLLGAILGLQFTVANQVRSAFSSAWTEVTGAVSTVTGFGFDILEAPFDIGRSLALSVGPGAFLVGPLAFAFAVAFVMIVITGSWYLYQVIPGT